MPNFAKVTGIEKFETSPKLIDSNQIWRVYYTPLREFLLPQNNEVCYQFNMFKLEETKIRFV